MLIHNDIVWNKPKNSTEFFSFIDKSHSFNSRQINRQISTALIILKLCYFGKNHSWKMEVFWIFCSWDQKIHSWFTNHEPIMPTLWNSESHLIRKNDQWRSGGCSVRILYPCKKRDVPFHPECISHLFIFSFGDAFWVCVVGWVVLCSIPCSK